MMLVSYNDADDDDDDADADADLCCTSPKHSVVHSVWRSCHCTQGCFSCRISTVFGNAEFLLPYRNSPAVTVQLLFAVKSAVLECFMCIVNIVAEIRPVWADNMSVIWVHLFKCAINHFVTRPFMLKGYKTALSYMTCYVKGLCGYKVWQWQTWLNASCVLHAL